MTRKPESILYSLFLFVLLSVSAPAQSSSAKNLGSSPVNQAGNVTAVSFASITGTPATYRMQYGLEFTINASTCSGNSCNVTFTPSFPGLRQDALVALDSSGSVIGTEYVYGIGEGPLPVFSPGTISTLYTPPSGANPFGIAKDSAGNIYFSNYLGNTVQKLDTLGNVTLFAGTGVSGFSGDGGPATSAELRSPAGLVIDGAGNLYIADVANARVRKVNSQGIITTIAGDGCYGDSGDGAAATAAALSFPYALAFDVAGDLYIADSGNNVVRKVNGNGIISTVAGLQGQSGTTGDGGPSTSAQIGIPAALTTDAEGNLYIGDALNSVVRKVIAAGIISTVAGTGSSGYSGDGGPGTGAELNRPYGLTVDPAGNLYISDGSNGYIRKVDTQGSISTIAGNGTVAGFSGDGGLATSAALGQPQGIVLGDDGSLYMAGITIRKISPMSSLTFPNTAAGSSSPSQALQLFNIGNQDQPLSAPLVNGDFALVSTCGSSPLTNLPAGCALNVSFAPTQPGIRTGVVVVSPNLIATLTGTGLVTGVGGVSPSSLNFGGVATGPSSTPQIVTVTNSGSGALGISSAVISGLNATDFSIVNNCPSSLAPGKQCTLSMSFTPSNAAVESGMLTITYTASTATSQSVALSGTGVSKTMPTSSPEGLLFVPINPCRVADTRNATGPFGGPKMAGGSTRNFVIPNGGCGIPASAAAYSLNVTVVPDAKLGYLTIWPAGQALPEVSTLNSDGRVKANAAIVSPGTTGGVSVYVTNPTHVILDVNGYFVPAGTASALALYPITPCRIADTRNPANALGGPFLTGGQTRSFPVLSSACNIPSTAQAYALNLTVLPHVRLGYLAMWPTGEKQSLASTLNTSGPVMTANAAIVAAGTDGAVSAFASNDIDLVMDIDGYFAPPTSGGLSLHPVVPCRVLDTRLPGSEGAFSGATAVEFTGSKCGLPSSAEAYVVNATVVPEAALENLSIGANSAAKLVVGTLDALDAAITSNMALVPTTNGYIDAYASGLTQLILDVSSYFAQ